MVEFAVVVAVTVSAFDAAKIAFNKEPAEDGVVEADVAVSGEAGVVVVDVAGGVAVAVSAFDAAKIAFNKEPAEDGVVEADVAVSGEAGVVVVDVAVGVVVTGVEAVIVVIVALVA